MTVVDEVLEANRKYARRFDQRGLPAHPRRKLAVVACMDARLDVANALGLGLGEAHVIRNAGGIVTDDVLRSLIVSHHVTGTQEIMVVNHTGCGMQGLQDEELAVRLERETGRSAPVSFHAFTDLEENVSRQIVEIQSHPWIPPSVAVRVFV